MRPILTKNILINEFQSYYWLKKELHLFCKEHHLPTSGSKEELTKRILYYLQIGEMLKPFKKTTSPSSLKKNIPLSLDTIIDEHHRCSQDVRSFFKSVIGSRFHFSTHIQKFFKENTGKTYQDAVKEWYKEEERKKDPSYQTKIGSQFQYNQFIRDYFQDPINKEKTRTDAIEAWNNVKKQPGNNKYEPKKGKNQ